MLNRTIMYKTERTMENYQNQMMVYLYLQHHLIQKRKYIQLILMVLESTLTRDFYGYVYACIRMLCLSSFSSFLVYLFVWYICPVKNTHAKNERVHQNIERFLFYEEQLLQFNECVLYMKKRVPVNPMSFLTRKERVLRRSQNCRMLSYKFKNQLKETEYVLVRSIS